MNVLYNNWRIIWRSMRNYVRHLIGLLQLQLQYPIYNIINIRERENGHNNALAMSITQIKIELEYFIQLNTKKKQPLDLWNGSVLLHTHHFLCIPYWFIRVHIFIYVHRLEIQLVIAIALIPFILLYEYNLINSWFQWEIFVSLRNIACHCLFWFSRCSVCELRSFNFVIFSLSLSLSLCCCSWPTACVISSQSFW